VLARVGSAAQKPPEFAAQAEIVTVNVMVLDRNGKPMPKLTRTDFVVKKNNRPQTVTAFEEIVAVLPDVVAPETTTSATSVSRIATNVANPPTRRTFAVVFDDMHVGDINIEQAKRAVETFVARDTAPGDRIVLVTVSDGRYWATNRGADDAAWREALKGVRSHRLLQGRAECRVTYYEAMQADLMGNRQVADLVDRRRQAICSIEPASSEELAEPSVPSWHGAGLRLLRGPPAAPQGVSQLMPSMPEEYARQRGQPRLGASWRLSPASATPPQGVVLVTEGFLVDPRSTSFEGSRANDSERRRPLPGPARPGHKTAGLLLRRRLKKNHPWPRSRADARDVETRGWWGEGARGRDGRLRAADERFRGWPRVGG
jgi:hypothetical protein